MLLALTALSMAWLVLQGVAGLGEGFVMLVPAMLLALPLLAGRYLGERTIERARLARALPTPPRRPRRRSPQPRPARALVPRGGLLVASSLATRPPPH